MPVPPACQNIANELQDLQAEKTALQEDLDKASTGEKSALVTQIKKLSAQITKKQQELNTCIAQNS